jgi:transmembrane sensor
MSWDRSDTSPLAQEAALWLIELDEPGEATLRRFAAWLETSPRHVEEFLLAAAVWKEFDHLDSARRLDVQRMVDEARRSVRPLDIAAKGDGSAGNDGGGGGTHVGGGGHIGGSGAHSPSFRRMLRFALAAAAAVIVVGIASSVFRSMPPQTYATTRGEQRALKLEDGSVVYLNTQSRVQVQFSKSVRAIRLLEGEAMFNVEHDAARPFRVMAGSTVIQAIGTRFNVYRSEAGATVSVVEGVVQISPDAATTASLPPAKETHTTVEPPAIRLQQARVSAGEQARVAPDGEIITHSVPDLAQIVAWRERRLVFRADRLEDVVTEFNRYNAVQIHILSDTLRGKQITGVFDADDPRSFVQFLQRDSALSVDAKSDEITVSLR